MKRYLWPFIPKYFQAALLRSQCRVDEKLLRPEIQVRVARSYEELKKAYQLLHNCYVGKGLMPAHPSGLRCSIHSFLPHNTVLIAVDKQDQVVATISIICDSPLRLPAESIFPNEIQILRNKVGAQLAEISALAVAKEYRDRSHSLQFLLNKFMYFYSKRVLKLNTFVIAIHPNASMFYHALFDFKIHPEIKTYSYVSGALAQFLHLEFSDQWEKSVFRNVYKSKKNSLMDYMLHQSDPRLELQAEASQLKDRITKETSIEIMRASKFDLNKLNRLEISYLISTQNYSEKDLQDLGLIGSPIVTEYRYRHKAKALIKLGPRSLVSEIQNLSRSGAFVHLPLEQIRNQACAESRAEELGHIQFSWKGNIFKSRFRICWRNQAKSELVKNLPEGLGIEFTDRKLNLFFDNKESKVA